MQSPNDNRVLALGVYLVDRPNFAAHISQTLQQSTNWKVDLRWAAVGSANTPKELRSATFATTARRKPKFDLLNDLIPPLDLEAYRYIIVTDDDIELADGFLDNYLERQTKYDLALAQPARTHDSYIDHKFVAQLLGVDARLTRFVEIGPLFSIRRDIYPLMLPFDEDAPMGWGLDFVWPANLEREGFRLGIIDAAPIKHALRKPVSQYDYDDTNDAMQAFLGSRSHVSRSAAFVAIETYEIAD